MSSSINSLANSAYYQLSDPLAGPGANTTQANPTTALLQALSSSSAAATSPSSAYFLDLSPQAQQLLNGAGLGSGGSTASGLPGSDSNFLLSTQQQQQISAILAKYADAPYTQATFDQIQNDLSTAGLGPQQLSLKDQAQNFNPTQLLIDDLNGDTSTADSLLNAGSNEQTKSSGYMQSILQQWQNISTTYQSSQAQTGAASGT